MSTSTALGCGQRQHSIVSCCSAHNRLQELGLDCVAWTPAVYHDLLRSGDGTAEGIVAAYFGMVCSCSLLQYTAQTAADEY